MSTLACLFWRRRITIYSEMRAEPRVIRYQSVWSPLSFGDPFFMRV